MPVRKICLFYKKPKNQATDFHGGAKNLSLLQKNKASSYRLPVGGSNLSLFADNPSIN